MKNSYLRCDVLIIFVLLIIHLLLADPAQAQLVINEFMASNARTITDDSGEYDDWIELHNPHDYPTNLSGLYLTDDFDNPTRWAFSDTSIAGQGYLLIWADDDTARAKLHASFKLKSGGGQIGLYDGSSFIDSLTYGEQSTDISYGRYPDGSAAWQFFEVSTPGSANAFQEPYIAEAPEFSIPGGFYRGTISVELSVSSPTAAIRYTLDSSDPSEQSSLYIAPIVIDTTTIIRAKTFDALYQPSAVVTHSYLFNEGFSIATLSLVTNPPNLWGNDSGIYRNAREHGESWERPASIEFFEGEGSPGLNMELVDFVISYLIQKMSMNSNDS